MATTNKVQGWLCLLMTEDSSFHWPTKPQTSLIRNVPARQFLSSFVFLDRRRMSIFDLEDLVSIDFFTLPTATFRILFVFIILRHDRRRIVHFNVTEHPSAEWTAPADR